MCTANCLLVILAILFPPLPVWIKRGLCSADSLINIALCLLGFIPGLIHAWYIIAITPDDYEIGRGYRAIPADDVERDGRTGYHYVNHPQAVQGGDAGIPRAQAQRGYGTVGPSTPAGPSGSEVPPTYSEAVKGDNKVQKP